MKDNIKGFFRSLFKNKKIFIPIGVLFVGLFIITIVGLTSNKSVLLNNKKDSQNGQNTQDSNGKNKNKSKNSKNKGSQAAQKNKSKSTINKPSFNNYINKAEKSGRISSEQAKLIEDKNTEIKKLSESLKDKDDTELMNLAQQKRAELRSWAKENKIPSNFINIILRSNGL